MTFVKNSKSLFKLTVSGFIKKTIRFNSSRNNDYNSYCMELLRKYDYENFLCSLLLPKYARSSVFAVRAYNIELAQVRDIVSDKNIGLMRLQFWKDCIEEIFQGSPRASPVVVSLARAIEAHQLSKKWLIQLIEAREENLEDRPFSSMDEVETYAGKTTTALNYLVLESLGVKDLNADHLASHLGRTQGIITLVRGITYHSQRNRVLLPIQLMVQHNVSQQDVIRGCREQKMKDLIYDITSEAHVHLQTARSLSKDVPKNSIPAFLPSVCCDAFLKSLQKVDFDVFDGRLHTRNNWLPLLLWLRNRKKTF